jgi:hypothetical protein
MTSEELAAALDAFATGAKRLITDRLQDLRAGFDELDRRARVQECVNTAGGKFSSVGLEWGTIEDFHKGIQGRIGGASHPFISPPTLIPFRAQSDG